MKKYGFTLAEVMVSLALIGVVASLTIPTFISNHHNKVHAAKLAATVNVAENAFTTMIAAETIDDLKNSSLAQNPSATVLSKYMATTKHGTSLSDIYEDSAPFRAIKGQALQPNVTFISQIKSGAVLVYHKSPEERTDEVIDYGCSVDGRIGYLTIDVNGKSKPNIWGRDVFYFMVGNNGKLYPAGGLNFSVIETADDTQKWDESGSSYACKGSVMSMGCTARLIENNYEVNY